jgi:hypothetical protein
MSKQKQQPVEIVKLGDLPWSLAEMGLQLGEIRVSWVKYDLAQAKCTTKHATIKTKGKTECNS